VWIKDLGKLIGLPSLIFVVCFSTALPAFAEVEITNIQTSPLQVHVGDSFKINATVVNNSTGTINFNGGCQSPISTTFDRNVAVGQAMGCFALYNVELKPGQNVTVVGPGSDKSYTATSSGSTDANITFAYQTGNKTETISKIFTFEISQSAPVPEFSSMVGFVFAAAIVSAIFVMVSKPNHNLFKP
jgi:hypothetical protein